MSHQYHQYFGIFKKSGGILNLTLSDVFRNHIELQFSYFMPHFSKLKKRMLHLHLFIFMHLADAFIQSDYNCIQAIHLSSVC